MAQVRDLVQEKMQDSMDRFDRVAGVTKAWNTVQHDVSMERVIMIFPIVLCLYSRENEARELDCSDATAKKIKSYAYIPPGDFWSRWGG